VYIVNTASFRLPEDLLGALERQATRARRPKSELVRVALEQYLKRADRQRETGLRQRVDELVTYEGSGSGDLAIRGEAILRARFRGRRRPR
jgi:metal-responsive CopG/Arc/MetJ family transcriptional regulator